MKRIVSLLIFSLFLVTLFAGCGFDTSSESEGSHHTQKWVTWKSISTGKYHTMGIRNDGALIGWGWNYYGQIGTGSFGQDEIIATPTQIGTDTDWKKVSSSITHTLAIKSDGRLFAWGDNADGGALGIGAGPDVYTPVPVGIKTHWVSISTGVLFSLAITSSGALYAWGDNTQGQLGDGTTTESPTPKQVGSDRDWAFVDAGHNHVLALKTDGRLFAWGRNAYGQGGDGTREDQSVPTEILPGTTWKSVAAGGPFSVAVSSGGELYTWGQEDYNNHGVTVNTPTRIGTDSDWCSVGAGDVSALAIKTDGTLYTWGELDHDAPLQPLLRIGEESDWKFVQCGLYHFAALKEDNTLWVWGNNMLGQLGDDTTEPSQTPIEIDLRQI